MTASARKIGWIWLAALVLAAAYQGFRLQANSFAPTGSEFVETNKAHYLVSEPVRISATGFAPYLDVTLQIAWPDGSAAELATTTDAGGKLEYAFTTLLRGRYVATILGPGEVRLASVSFTAGAIVQTDKEDYQPYETVVVTGTGWLAGETVSLLLHEDADFHGDRTLYATADADGNFVNTEFAPEPHDIGVTFTLTATGQTSGYVAETTFKDSFTVNSRATGNWFTASTWSAARTGTITTTLVSSTVTGVGTFFLTELAPGDVITNTSDAVVGTVASIGSDTSLTLTGNAAIALAAQPYRARRVPANDDDVVVNPNHTVTVDANASANSVSTSTSTTTGLRALTISGTNSLTVAAAVNLTNTGANPSAQLNVNAGSVTAATLTADMNSATVTITTGSASISGAATIQGSTSTGALATLDVGNGDFSAASLSIQGGGGGSAQGRVLIGSSGEVIISGDTTIDANSGLATLNVGAGSFSGGGNLAIIGGGNGAKVGLATISTGTATVTGNVTFTNNSGVAELQFTGTGIANVGGNFGGGGTLETATGAGSTIHFDGAGAKTMGAYTTYRNVQIEKTGGGSVTLTGTTTVNENLHVLSGTFDHGASFNLTAGSIDVDSGATYRDVGTGDLTLAGGVSNAGTILMNGGTTACGEADSILIRSTVGGTQRSWSGGSTFDLQDVDVQDQAGSATIFVLSGTDNGNNGANWNFVAGCVAPTATPTSSATDTPTPTPTDTPSDTPTNTPTDTPTNTPTDTPTNTPTDTPTNTPTDTPTPTPTDTPTNTPTDTPTDTPTNSPTDTPTNTPTDTPTNTPTDTPTNTPTDTPTPTPTDTPANTPTDTPTDTPTPTPTPTDTPVPPTDTPTQTPTDTPTQTPTDTPLSATSTPTPTPVPDLLGPITSNVVANPDPAPVNTAITLTALVDDTTTGNSNIASAEFRVDAGAWMAMAAQDGSFDSPTENVTANIGLFASASVHVLCVRGTDVPGNVGAASCIFFAVYDPRAGFVTGAGWINSPAGAYVAGPSLIGKAHFGFVSSYQQRSTNPPVGQTEFQFQVASLNFHSIVYEWLVISGARAQYKGTGTVNGAGSYGFLLTAIDGQINGGGGLDKLRMKIWNKNAGDALVYDNQVACGDQSDTANPCTALGGGSIIIHKKK